MVVIRVLELFAFLLAVYLVYTQIIRPSWRGTVFFPLFRRSAVAREEELKKKLEEVAQLEVEKELSAEIQTRSKQLKGKK